MTVRPSGSVDMFGNGASTVDFMHRPQDGGAGSLTETVVRTVLQFIFDNRMSPGSALPSEIEVAKKLGISRGVVREAFRGLTSLGIVETGNGRSPRVRKADGDVLALLTEYAVQTEQVTIQQIMDVRQVIEARIAQLAAMHRSEREADAILASADALAAAQGDVFEMTRRDIDFHLLLAKAARNPFMRLQVESFKFVIERTGPLGWQCRTTDAEVTSQIRVHREIAECVKAQDTEGAVAAMSRHFTDTLRVLAQAGIN
ncbi:FadR/GntR family transcriptional regulator [Bauldia sp.]|uniref:FadR/GntR family transcriptional regulator n=1 Tax=Bauldia sp. TaxID=2575872 RepID=UPI003BAB4644